MTALLAATLATAATAIPTSARAADPAVAKVCGGRKGCKLKSRKDAGRDASGSALAVLELGLGKNAELNCENLEHWLVAKARDGALTTTRLLELCNDGYGASGVGEDHIDVGKNRFTHEQNGGASERWQRKIVLRLSPLTLLEEGYFVNVATGSSESNDEWSWEAFQGRGTWSAPDCGPNGQPKDDDGPETVNKSHAYAWLPQAPLEPAFAAGGWKTTAFGTCAARADSGGKAGFVTFGEPGKPADARFAAVLDGAGALYLEIEDDVIVGPSAKWLSDDHVELWLGAERPDEQPEGCIGPVKTKPQQWGIRVSDGQVFAAYGNPDAGSLKVELAPRAPGTAGPVRMRLQLPKGWKGITVAYSDSDDGRKQKRLIATSALEFRNGRTLGMVKEIKPDRASCRVANGRLDAVVKEGWTQEP
jgi:hypothetical protein